MRSTITLCPSDKSVRTGPFDLATCSRTTISSIGECLLENDKILNKVNLVGVYTAGTLAGLGGMLVGSILGWLGVDLLRLPLLPQHLVESSYGFIRVFLPGTAAVIAYASVLLSLRGKRFMTQVRWLPDIAAMLVAVACGTFVW